MLIALPSVLLELEKASPSKTLQQQTYSTFSMLAWHKDSTAFPPRSVLADRIDNHEYNPIQKDGKYVASV